MISYTGKNAKVNNNAIIVFTREPEPGKTKTRLMPYFTPEQCAALHRCMIKDISSEIRKADADTIVAYTCDDGVPDFLWKTMGSRSLFIRQTGKDIGSRMKNAIEYVLGLGYKKAVLIGTDIPEIEAKTINAAFSGLDGCDVVMGSTEDGGYYLIGMKSVHPEAFSVSSYGVSTVFEETVASLENAGLTVETANTCSDMDTRDDIAGFRMRMRRSPRLRSTNTGRFIAENARISVIVPVYNESSEIEKLTRQLIPYGNDCEIIIVDGGSTDNTRDILNSIHDDNRVSVMRTEKGRAVQMNAGAQASSGDILFFLHCDSMLPERFTEEIRCVMASNDWGCFRLTFPSHNFFMFTNRIASNLRALSRKLPFGDQGIFIDRKIFFEAGMFPEIPIMEDYEFSLRMRNCKELRGPGLTHKKLITSDRRYGFGTVNILSTEFQMWKLRHKYRKGVSTDILRNLYKDIR